MRDAHIHQTAALHAACSPGETLRAPDEAGPWGRSLLPLLSVREGAEAEGAPVSGREVLTLDGLLGEGGMGRVFAATQRSLDRTVAVKIVDADRDDAQASLLREARIAGGLEHPNIVPIHLLGLDAKGAPVLVMKRVEGVSLAALLRDDEHPDWPRLRARHGDRTGVVVEVLLRVCDALELAHARGVVHRDIKPDNVMIGPFGEVYLLDWGVALDLRRAEGTAVVGTPTYMAPEMVGGLASDVTPATDVYLLGATLHAALTGTARHTGATMLAVLFAASRSEPVAYGEGVPAELAALCNDATALDPAARPATARAFQARLLDFLRHREATTLCEEAARVLATASSLPRDAAWRALTEARFGFTQALREWPEAAAAREGLTRVTRAMLGHALDEGNPEAAARLLRALPSPDEGLAEAVEALAARVTAERALAARVDRQRDEMDPTRSARGRIVLMMVLSALALTITLALALGDAARGAPPPLADVAKGGVFVVVAMGVAAVALRRRLTANVYARRMSGILFAAVVVSAVGDLAGLAIGAGTLAATRMKFVLVGVVAASASAMGFRWLLLPGAIAGAAAVATALAPERLSLVSLVGVNAVAVATLWLVQTDRLRQAVHLDGGTRPEA